MTTKTKKMIKTDLPLKEEIIQDIIKEPIKGPIKELIKEPIKQDKPINNRRLGEIVLFQIVISVIGWLLILPFITSSIIPTIIFMILSLSLIILNLKKRKEIEDIKRSSIDNRIHIKLLYGSHIVLFLHKENNQSSIIGKKQVHSLTECVRLNGKEIAYKIDTSKPTFIWGNIRLYLIDCESSQQISMNENEKVINIHTVYDFCYKEALYKMTKSVHKGNLQNLSLLIGFVMGFGIIGLILMILINYGVI